jgi:hypothetical protein
MRQVLGALIGLGLWIAASPWLLGFSSVNLARWSNVLAGGLIAIGALSLMTKGERA